MKQEEGDFRLNDVFSSAKIDRIEFGSFSKQKLHN